MYEDQSSINSLKLHLLFCLVIRRSKLCLARELSTNVLVLWTGVWNRACFPPSAVSAMQRLNFLIVTGLKKWSDEICIFGHVSIIPERASEIHIGRGSYTFSYFTCYCRFEMNNYKMNEHAGTHIDAPTHFNENGWDPSEIPLERLVDLPACVIDISARALQDPHAQLQPGRCKNIKVFLYNCSMTPEIGGLFCLVCLL